MNLEPLFHFRTSEAMCPHVGVHSFGSKSFAKTLLFPSRTDSLANMDKWMELPLAPAGTKHSTDASSESAERAKPTAKTKRGGKGFSNKADGQVGHGDKLAYRALLNLDQRLRTVEDIIEDSLDVPVDLEEIKVALRVGPNYQSTVQGPWTAPWITAHVCLQCTLQDDGCTALLSEGIDEDVGRVCQEVHYSESD